MKGLVLYNYDSDCKDSEHCLKVVIFDEKYFPHLVDKKKCVAVVFRKLST